MVKHFYHLFVVVTTFLRVRMTFIEIDQVTVIVVDSRWQSSDVCKLYVRFGQTMQETLIFYYF